MKENTMSEWLGEFEACGRNRDAEEASVDMLGQHDKTKPV